MTTPLDKVRDRYMNDAAFHAMVDMMRHAITDLQLTPGELRDAAMLAALIEEERRPMPVFPINPTVCKGPYR